MCKVTVTADVQEDHTRLKIGDMTIAIVFESGMRKQKYNGWAYGFGGHDNFCDNKSYPDALEFVSDVIERRFNRFGLGVEFK